MPSNNVGEATEESWPPHASPPSAPQQTVATNIEVDAPESEGAPRSYQHLVNMLTKRGIRLSRPNRASDAPPRSWQNDTECPICLECFTDKIFLEPCGHVCDFACFQVWLESHLEHTFGQIPDHELWIVTPRLITCPLCRQEAEISGPDNGYVIPAQAIYLSAVMLFEDNIFRDSAPITDIFRLSLQRSLVGFGWRLQFGFQDELIHGYWSIQVQDLIARDRQRGFPPVIGFINQVRGSRTLTTVGELIGYRRFVEILVHRNIQFDRMLNFAGLYDGRSGPYTPDNIVTAEGVFSYMREVFLLLEERTARQATLLSTYLAPEGRLGPAQDDNGDAAPESGGAGPESA